ncbi:hypothetical protein IFM89_008259 [Coptis chinensis]|uniref:Autophagy-related protein 13 N-terminal domain-containing protein n=1 Tax=Coptis chinensis TaxID=261450 RepID=A0A835IAT5_9MAGN|nr:hypothetical protein IFM89_008259 [Coptis chinensis]
MPLVQLLGLKGQLKDSSKAVIVADIIRPHVHLLQTVEFDIKKEATWAISNATSGGDNEQTKVVLCDLLICPDPRIVIVCLERLENILKVGEAEKNAGHTEGMNVFAQLIDEAEGLEKIENLQSHDNTDFYEKVVKILETYWLEDDGEVATDPPGEATQPGFNFGGRTTISPWIVTLDALEPFSCDASKQEPQLLPYLAEKNSKNYDISLEVHIVHRGVVLPLVEMLQSPDTQLREIGEQILLSSPSPTSSSHVRPKDKWFNLALKECPAVLENLDLWRQSNLEPMVVDVVLVKRPVDIDPVGF